jgi:hypothetical protein
MASRCGIVHVHLVDNVRRASSLRSGGIVVSGGGNLATRASLRRPRILRRAESCQPCSTASSAVCSRESRREQRTRGDKRVVDEIQGTDVPVDDEIDVEDPDEDKTKTDQGDGEDEPVV